MLRPRTWPQCVLVFGVAPVHNQLRAGLVDSVACDSRLQDQERGIVGIAGGSEHSLHPAGNGPRPDEVDSLYVTALPFIADAEIELYKIAVLDSVVILPYMLRRVVTD